MFRERRGMADSHAASPSTSNAGLAQSTRRSAEGRKRHDLQCSHCQRLFSKPEHLKRHEHTHVGLKQFQCSVCSKSFARNDSLKRHERAHIARRPRRPLSGPNVQEESDNPDENNTGDHTGLATIMQTSEANDVDGLDADLFTNLERTYPDSINVSNDGAQVSQDLDAIVHVDQGPHSIPPLHSPWPTCDDLMNMLINENAFWPMDSQLSLLDPNTSQHVNEIHRGTSDDDASSSRARQAMIHMSSMIQDLSFNLAKEVESTGVTSDFLDTCLNAFFDRFVPIFPVSHQPTFSLKDCAHPVLLNLIALGSVFVALDDALDRGEALWRLAHLAVATSWQGMMNHLSQGDVTTGVQLVMTALLGQSYALLSGSHSFRLTSHVFHGLGFYWARQCGMPVTDLFTDLPTRESTYDEKRRKWKAWAAQETRHRALLGHYILDGLISQSSGLPTSDRHMTNRMILPSSDSVYEATTVAAWHEAMQQHPQSDITFREVYMHLFDPASNFMIELSSFAIRVVLEGFQSLISDRHEAGGLCVGVPDTAAISGAMWRLLRTQIDKSSHSDDIRLDLTLRWHIVSLEICVNTNQLVRNLCQAYEVKQDLYNSSINSLTAFDYRSWTNTRAARRALLHASAAVRLITSLSFRRIQAIHVPLAAFTTALVFLASSLAGRTKASIPTEVDWKVVCETNLPSNPYTRTMPDTMTTAAYLDLGTDVWNPRTTVRGFSYHVNTLQRVLESLSSTWGIAKEMNSVIRQLLVVCNSQKKGQ